MDTTIISNEILEQSLTAEINLSNDLQTQINRIMNDINNIINQSNDNESNSNLIESDIDKSEIIHSSDNNFENIPDYTDEIEITHKLPINQKVITIQAFPTNISIDRTHSLQLPHKISYLNNIDLMKNKI